MALARNWPLSIALIIGLAVSAIAFADSEPAQTIQDDETVAELDLFDMDEPGRSPAVENLPTDQPSGENAILYSKSATLVLDQEPDARELDALLDAQLDYAEGTPALTGDTPAESSN